MNNILLTTRCFLKMASAAAVVASACDLLLLYVIVAPSGLATAARSLVVASGVLGAIAIPFYVLGYAAIARCIEPGSRVLRRGVVGSGVIVGVGGGAIHGATAIFMLRAQAAGVTWEDPMAGVLHSGFVLPMLWGLAVVAAACASVVLVYAAFTGRLALRTAVVVVNPVVVTVLLVAVSLACGSETLGNFFAPAAPNLAHLIFFVVAAASVRLPQG